MICHFFGRCDANRFAEMHIASVFKWRFDVSPLKFRLCGGFYEAGELCDGQASVKVSTMCLSLFIAASWRWPSMTTMTMTTSLLFLSAYFSITLFPVVCSEIWSQWHQWLWNRQPKTGKKSNNNKWSHDWPMHTLSHLHTSNQLSLK